MLLLRDIYNINEPLNLKTFKLRALSFRALSFRARSFRPFDCENLAEALLFFDQGEREPQLGPSSQYDLWAISYEDTILYALLRAPQTQQNYLSKSSKLVHSSSSQRLSLKDRNSYLQFIKFQNARLVSNRLLWRFSTGENDAVALQDKGYYP